MTQLMTSDDEPDLGARIAEHPTKQSAYASPSILGRRKRILHEARKLLAEKGLQGFAIRELCRRAEVAQRTLYNAFHSKDRLIALAIREAYDAANAKLNYSTSADTLEGIIDRLISINTRNRGAHTYSRVIASLYFSTDIAEDIRRAIQDMAFTNLKKWLKRVELADEFQPGIRREYLAADLANIEFAIINDWAEGRIADKEFVLRIVRSVLTFTAGATRGKTQQQAHRYLDDIAQTGELPRFPHPR